MVENLPALADAAARGMAGAHLTVLNGTEGVSQMAAGLVSQGLAILDTLQNTKDPTVNGKSNLRIPARPRSAGPAAGPVHGPRRPEGFTHARRGRHPRITPEGA
ncbi:hypothetical protein ACR6C2_30540 [Streptomyces sp. INA 01156]